MELSTVHTDKLAYIASCCDGVFLLWPNLRIGLRKLLSVQTRSKLASKVWLNHMNEELQVNVGNEISYPRPQGFKQIRARAQLPFIRI